MTFTDGDIRKFITRPLLEWYEKNGRNYPWRRSRNPYEVLIAEIMLQRTKADQVLPVYLSFIRKFPTVKKLNKASTEAVKSYFDRLGLMWRAELVKRLAGELITRFNGKIPESRKELLSLPSVGEYVADAVLSFARGKNVAVVDANVCRVIGRVFGLKPRGEARRDRRFRDIAQRLAAMGDARRLNWAIIDLAALVCTPKNPKCHICPLKERCSYYKKLI
jgi:A/G-specific adenine glycosylase